MYTFNDFVIFTHAVLYRTFVAVTVVLCVIIAILLIILSILITYLIWTRCCGMLLPYTLYSILVLMLFILTFITGAGNKGADTMELRQKVSVWGTVV